MEFSKPEIVLWLRRVLPMFLGALGGYLYYSFIGCLGGTCPITSNPWTSTAYGAVVGFFAAPWRRLPHRNDAKE